MKRLVIIIFIFATTLVMGRDIYIGTPVVLKVEDIGLETLRSELEEQGVELEESKVVGSSAYLKVRLYKVGENKITLNGTPIIIDVRSALLGEKEIVANLDDGSNLVGEKEMFPFLFLIGVIAGIVSLMSIRYKKVKNISPQEIFYSEMDNIGSDYSYDISRALRVYIDSLLGSKLISGEYSKLDKDIKDFLYELDYQKFSSRKNFTKELLKERAISIARDIEGRGEDRNV